MIKKRLYEKPLMKVFELKQKPALLAGSMTTTAEFEDYGDGNFSWDEDE